MHVRAHERPRAKRDGLRISGHPDARDLAVDGETLAGDQADVAHGRDDPLGEDAQRAGALTADVDGSVAGHLGADGDVDGAGPGAGRKALDRHSVDAVNGAHHGQGPESERCAVICKRHVRSRDAADSEVAPCPFQAG